MVYVIEVATDSNRSAQIVDFLRAPFHYEPFAVPNSSTLEAVIAELVGSDQVRDGKAPPLSFVENHLTIRDVLTGVINDGSPIPILTPWGSKKTLNGQSIDVAEIGALKQIASLQERVKRHYLPGIQVNLRLDDISGYHLFAGQGDEMRPSCVQYCTDVQRLVNIMGLSSFVTVIPESTLTNEATFNYHADSAMGVFCRFLTRARLDGFDSANNSVDAKALENIGWHGGLSEDMCQYYIKRYAKIYGAGEMDSWLILARCFAGTLARIKLNCTGTEPSWGKSFIKLTFLNPVPGTPEKFRFLTVNYRTFPRKFTRDHNPPWRMKGYLELGEEVRPKLLSWFVPCQTKPCAVSISDGHEKVSVRADYIITN